MTPIDQSKLSTREYIVQLLKTKGELSIKELSEALGITVMAVSRHIQSLERDHHITSKTIRQSMGRPTAVYGLTEQAKDFFPLQYQTLSLELLSEIEDHFGEVGIEKVFVGRKNKLFQKFAKDMQGQDFTERITRLAEIQNENGYMVELSKLNDTEFLLQEHHCPIEQVATKYPLACECELQLFESLLDGAEVQRTECLADGGHRCTYQITSRKSHKQ